MSVFFDKENRIFKLDTKTSTYAMLIGEGGYLIHLYYGEKLPDRNLKYLMYRGWFDSLSPFSPDVTDPLFSADITPMELPANGAGDFRISALSVKKRGRQHRDRRALPWA